MTASFRRAPDFDRRADMIESTLDCIADLGIQATTVRAVAAHAGVSNGLIRHHFASKNNLIVAAYRRTIEMMTAPGLEVLDSDGTPHERLARFIAASLGGAVGSPRMLSLWATFIAQVQHDPELAAEHRAGYLAYRRATETLIAEVLAAEGRAAEEPERERLGIAFNALMDGLWIEGCLSPEEIHENLRIDIGLRAVERLLGITLAHPRDGKD